MSRSGSTTKAEGSFHIFHTKSRTYHWCWIKTLLPWLFHPSLQANMPAGLFDLQGWGVSLVPTQSLCEVSGILSWQAARGWEARWTFGVAQGVALYNQRKSQGEKEIVNTILCVYYSSFSYGKLLLSLFAFYKSTLNFFILFNGVCLISQSAITCCR